MSSPSDAQADVGRARPGRGPAALIPSSSAGLMDALRVGVVVLGPQAQVLLWSPLAEELLGWRGDQVVGRPLDRLLAGWDGSGPSRDATAPSAEQLVVEVMRSGGWVGRLRLRHRDGRLVDFEGRASLMVDGEGRPYIPVALADARLVHRMEHDLAVVDSVIDNSPLGIAVYDTGLRIVRVNQTLVRMTGRSAEEHLGRTIDEVIPGETGRELALVQRTVLETGRPVVDFRTRSADGVGFQSASYSRITDRAGRVLGITSLVMDVTERIAGVAKVERARARLALLNDVGGVLAGLLDVRRLSGALAEVLVPAFCDYAAVLLLPQVAGDGELPRGPHRPGTPLLLQGAAWLPGEERAGEYLRVGRLMGFPEDSELGRMVAGRRGAWRIASRAEIRDPEALELGVGSVLAAPLRARGTVLGLLVVGRDAGREGFDEDDLTLAAELADRGAAGLDNARMYARERQGALMLQRSLLPQHLPRLPGIEIAYRYLPGSTGAEAGGDWFDVVPLAGGRAAFMVGDVMGHGLRAAATMGRMRTAVRTLAGLDLPPGELLRRVNDLSEDFAPGPDEPMMATCVYAVYDPSTRICSIAKAGHLPPLLVVEEYDERGRATCRVRTVEMPEGTPIGMGAADFAAVAFEPVEVEVPRGAVLVLYTDGLVEARGEDIGEGIDRLRRVLSRPHDCLEDACDDLLSTLVPASEPDDVAVLMARLGELPKGGEASWTFPRDAAAVHEARERVRATLTAWGLGGLVDITALLVSELVTNSLRYARGPIDVRLVRGTTLLAEVSDRLPDPPRARSAHDDEEGGRGLQLLARTARRWGTRQGPQGKTVWFELALPGT